MWESSLHRWHIQIYMIDKVINCLAELKRNSASLPSLEGCAAFFDIEDIRFLYLGFNVHSVVIFI